jgi:very-short-patch-repair endonuclease
MSTLSAESVDLRIDRWRRNLVDTSLRNRLLDVKESRLGCLRLTSPSPRDIYGVVVEQKDTFEVEIGRNGSATCAPMGAPRPLMAEKGRGDRSLMLMRTKAREALREQGVNILFLTMGILEWSSESTQGQVIRSPLVLVPVELSRSGPLDPYVLKSAGAVSANPTLGHKLRSELALTLPPLPEGAVDLEAYLGQVRRTFQRLGWTVEDTAYLGLFKFPKMCMFDELGQHREMVAGHPVIRALSGEPTPVNGAEPRTTVEGGEFQVLDADYSQREAVALALSGASFVLQGPPGTGKSQTITNIIAEAISRGRTVLFVSEKMAALEVVKKRLDARGMGDYCLEMHSYDTPRQEVVGELSRCLSAPPAAEPTPPEREDLIRAQGCLDDYVNALHRPRDGLGISYHQLLSELIALRPAADLPITFPNLERTGWKDLEPLRSLVRDVERFGPLLADGSAHPWSDCLVDSWKLTAQTEVVHRLSAMKLATGRLVEALTRFCGDLQLDIPRSLQEVEDLITHLRTVNLTAYPEEGWLAHDPTPLLELLNDAQAAYLGLGERMAWLRQLYREDVLALDLHLMNRRFQNEYQSAIGRLVHFHYQRDMGTLRSLYRGERKLRFETAREDVEEIVKISDQVTALHALETECGERLGKRFQGESTDWDKTRTDIKWTVEYYRKYGTPVSPGIVRLLCSGPEVLIGFKTKVDGLQEVAMATGAAVSEVAGSFDLRRLTAGRTIAEVPFDALLDWVQDHMDSLSSFQEWTEAHRARKEAVENGLGDMLMLSSQGSLPTSGLWDSVRKRFLTLWHDLLLSQDRRLRDFDREAHERTVDRFVELDRRYVQRAASRARSVLEQRRKEVYENSSPENGSGLWVLRHEVSRKRNGRPVRELFSQAAVPILCLKPCLLMSPLSVSTFLDPTKVTFDLVIFDEASQVRPEDAIGSIMRARQVIVVGDSKQLPPTDFFREVNDEDEDVPDLESILDECSSSMPQRMLLWHYRSRQESLIAFSNRRFYGGRLVTFPSAAVDREGLGVSFVQVPEGRYDRARTRKNLREAEVVAKLAIDHLTDHTNESLGVVAFSEAQQLAIIEELERCVAKRPALAPLLSEEGEDGFFVKNLENVQGDERDVMIFSVGYGRDENGRMSQNFGPLNKAGGERRLNVAITRAKMRAIIVASIGADDVIATGSQGTRLLNDYLAYAASGGSREVLQVNPVQKYDLDLPLEDDVHRALVAEGMKVRRQVGCSGYRIDLAVEDPQRPGTFLLGIECDGSSYRSGKTARDRDRIRWNVLRGLGWSMHRIWSRDWIIDRGSEVEKVKVALAKALGTKAGDALGSEEAGPEKETFLPALLNLVRERGPVHVDIAKDVLDDHVRHPEDVDKVLSEHLYALVRDGTVAVRDGFIWPGEMVVPRVRRPPGREPMELDYVSVEEIGEAELYCMGVGFHTTRGELVERTASFYRHETLTEKARTRLEAGIDNLISRGRLLAPGGDVLLRAR